MDNGALDAPFIFNNDNKSEFDFTFLTTMPVPTPLQNTFQDDNFSIATTPQNILQDDNFSIATVNELNYMYGNVYDEVLDNTVLPLDSNAYSTYSMSPYSTPETSPELSEMTIPNTYTLSTQPDYNMPYLADPYFYQEMPKNTNKKRKATADNDKRHVCHICNHRSKRRHNLVEHMLTHDPNRPKSFLCGQCNRAFARKYDMKRHEKIHNR
ncbi:hypothetical protein K501DRAFT_258227, partial [Backusella circina FSU 941]